MFVTIQPMHSASRSSPSTRSSRSTSRSPRRSSGTTGGAVPRSRSARPRPGRCRTSAGFAIVADAGLEALAERRHRARPGLHAAPARCRRTGARRAARRPRARRAHGLDLHRRVRARRRRHPRRPPRHHPLARRRRPRRPPPARSASSRTCSTSTRATCSPRPASPRASTSACTSCAATTAPRSPTAIARRIVVPPHREGGQAQYVDQPVPEQPGGSLAATRAWALERLHEPLTVRTLAAHAHVSERTFARRFTAETGVPVLRWLLAQRVDAARAALESTDASIDEIADRCGFGTAANLRKHFHRHVCHHPDGLPPHLRP